MSRTAFLCAVIVLAFLPATALAGTPGKATVAQIARAARPYVISHAQSGTRFTVRSVTVSSPATFAIEQIHAPQGGATVLLRKLANGTWFPVALGSAFDCAQATAKLFATMHVPCTPPDDVNVQTPPTLPGTLHGSTSCGTVSGPNGSHFRVYVTFGHATCPQARALVPQNMHVRAPWTYWDWTKGGNGPWTDTFERSDAGAVVAAILVM